MSALAALRRGLALARHHAGLALLYWGLATAPAVLLAAMAAELLAPLDSSAFASRVLHGEWLPVWLDLEGGSVDAAWPLVAGLLLLVLVTALAHVVLAGGVVEVLLGASDRPAGALLFGTLRNAWRFVRAATLLVVASATAVAVAGAAGWVLRRLAERTGDARWDLVALGVASLVGCLLLAPLVMAYDLARLAAARHDQCSMLAGFRRALGVVLRRPMLFLPLAVVLALLPVALHVGYHVLRRPFTPGSAAALLLLLVAQQTVMATRGFLKVVSWSALLACYRELGEPELCR